MQFSAHPLQQSVKVDIDVRMNKQNLCPSLPDSLLTTRISTTNWFLFCTPYFQTGYYLPVVSYQLAVLYNCKTCYFLLPHVFTALISHVWYPSCPFFHFLVKKSEHSHYQGSSAKSKPTQITVCLFKSAFQQKCKHLCEYPTSHSYPSFRVKIPSKIKTLQATFTRNTQNYSFMNTLWPELVFLTSELLWILPFCQMLKDGFLQYP